MSKARDGTGYPIGGGVRTSVISVVDWLALGGALLLIWFVVTLILQADSAYLLEDRLDRMDQPSIGATSGTTEAGGG